MIKLGEATCPNWMTCDPDEIKEMSESEIYVRLQEEVIDGMKVIAFLQIAPTEDK